MDSATALSELKNFQGTRKSAGDYYKESQNELGVGDAKARQDDLKGLIRNTETQLKGVGASVAGRTRGNLVTEAQRARLQNLETAPIAQQLTDRAGEFSDAQTNYRDLLSQAGTQAGLGYQTDTDKASALQSMYDKLFGKEQADIQQAQWQKQFDETRRQAEAQMAEARRQSAATLARIASLTTPSVATAAPVAAKATPKYNTAGQIAGYDTPTSSFLTQAGQAEEDAFWKKQNKGNWWDNIVGNVKGFGSNIGRMF